MKLIALLIVAFLPPLILAVNFLYLVLTRSTYEQIFQKLSIYQNFSSQDEAIYLIDNLIGYFRGKNMLEQNFFSTQAVLHLADVKQVFKTIKIINLFSLAVVSFSMILLIFTKKCSLIAMWKFKVYRFIVAISFHSPAGLRIEAHQRCKRR